jgi:predicted amidophosphoribosyltransferase
MNDLDRCAKAIKMRRYLIGEWICSHCGQKIDVELTECPNCGWHPMPNCAEAYKTP